MANTVERGLVSKSSLTAIGDAIRAKNGSTTKYKPSEMAAAIKSIKGEDIIVTTGDKYTLKVINPSNATIVSSLVGKIINNSDGTVSAGITDNSTYKPYTGYDPGAISRSFDKDTGVYTVTGTAAKPTSIIDSHGFARFYGKVNYSDIYLYTSDSYSGIYKDLESQSGKIFIAGLYANRGTDSYVTCSVDVYAFFDPCNIDAYCGIYTETNDKSILAYYSMPSYTGNNFKLGHWAGQETFKNLKYVDCGFAKAFSRFFYGGSALPTMVIRNIDGKIAPPNSGYFTKVTNLYVPSSLLSAYKADSMWSKHVTNFIALEGSKYEDPYAFLDEIPT